MNNFFAELKTHVRAVIPNTVPEGTILPTQVPFWFFPKANLLSNKQPLLAFLRFIGRGQLRNN